MCVLMDHDEAATRLIGDLLVRAGMLMEDESGEMIRQMPAEHDQISARIARLARVAADLASLASAAGTLLRLHEDAI